MAGAETRGDPTDSAPGGDAVGLGAQLDEWAAELDAWAQRRRGLVELLEVVTREQAGRPHGEQLAARNRQLRAILDQLQAMGEQVRAVRQQLAALHAAPGGAAGWSGAGADAGGAGGTGIPPSPAREEGCRGSDHH